jgi:calcineurin-like phosphoesterase family protein
MADYVIADLHLSHRRILQHQPNRPWHSIEEHDAALESAWNAQVRRTDRVFVLGDWSFGRELDEMRAQFARFRGTKILVRGNHDEDNAARVLALPWRETHQYLELVTNRTRFVMCHYPLESWRSMRSGAVHLHGHSHGGASRRPHRFDVGIDAVQDQFGFGPAPLEHFVEDARAQGDIERSDRPARCRPADTER